MTQRFGIGFLGLGSIGQRMLTHAALHQRVRATVVFDPQSHRVQDAAARFDHLLAADTALELIQHPAVDVVYIASPPLTHAEHARAAVDAGKPVLCEKPLGVNLDESRALVEHTARGGVPHAVNFIYASAQPAVVMHDAMRDGSLGKISAVDITIDAHWWAQRRYAEAPWLARHDQGGLVREVLSHYLFLTESLLGPARLRYANVQFPETQGAAVTQLVAELACDGIPIYVRGTTEGATPDRFEMTLRGEHQSLCAYDLYKLRAGNSRGWADRSVSGDPAADWHRRQFDNLAKMLAGEPHSMPDFAAAYSVQALVEAITAATGTG